jgi:hypothetical protein
MVIAPVDKRIQNGNLYALRPAALIFMSEEEITAGKAIGEQQSQRR